MYNISEAASIRRRHRILPPQLAKPKFVHCSPRCIYTGHSTRNAEHTTHTTKNTSHQTKRDTTTEREQSTKETQSPYYTTQNAVLHSQPDNTLRDSYIGGGGLSIYTLLDPSSTLTKHTLQTDYAEWSIAAPPAATAGQVHARLSGKFVSKEPQCTTGFLAFR